MTGLELLNLDLRSSLEYRGLENPPLPGAPLAGTVQLPGEGGSLVELRIGGDMAEGEEELFLFDEENLVDFDPDEGPKLKGALPSPRFYGRRPARGASMPGWDGLPAASLAAGGYSFLQWRPRDEQELAEGFEWFARESWWERSGAQGPYFLRRVREDGKLATQILRRLPG